MPNFNTRVTSDIFLLGFFIMILIFVCLTSVLVWYLQRFVLNKSFKSPPPLPGWLPIIGHVHLYLGCDATSIWDIYKKIAKDCASKGGIVTFSLGPRDIFFVTEPEDAYSIANSSIEKNFVYDIAKPWLGDGLLTSNGATWRAHRKIMTSAFTQRILNGLMPVFNHQARRLADDLNKEEGIFNPEPLLIKNNLETICQTSLGLDVEKHQDIVNDYARSIKELFEIMYERFVKIWLHSDITFYFTSLKRKHDKVLKGLHNLSNTIIEKRRRELKQLKKQQPLSDNFMPILDAILVLSMEKELLTAKELREELDTLLFGGHDTSATLLTYILMLLGTDKARQEKAFQEIIDVFGDSRRDVETEDLPKLHYLEFIIKESLRLYPIGPAFPRIATKDVKTKNYIFPSGSCFLLDVWSIHRHPMWGPDAEKFNPERWQDTDRLPHFQKAFGGFGVGKRTCIGRIYAMMALKVNLVHLLRRYKVTADINKLTLKMDALLRPHSGNLISIEKRK